MLSRLLSPDRVAGWLRKSCPSFFRTLLNDEFVRHTDNYSHLTWMGVPVWQNIADLWVIQEVISQLRPALIVETGTNRGGSSLFYAHLMDLLGEGRIVTVDVEKLHHLQHPRVTCLHGNSTAPEILQQVRAIAADITGQVLVILDSDHSASHVMGELREYQALVPPGGYVLVQDGIIDTLPRFTHARPGPLPAIEQFLAEHPNFQIDEDLCQKFPISHHPRGWLKRMG